MIVEPLAIPGLLLIQPRVFRDGRGYFRETWRAAEYAKHGMGPFVQDNVSVSRRGVIRGLHLQYPRAQGKLISVLHGRAFDVAVDVRRGSPTFAKWVSTELSDENGWQLYIPPGFAHGFQALSDTVVFSYKCTDTHAPEAERVVRWNDPALAISWPLRDAGLAERDLSAPLLADIPAELMPSYPAADG
jgi:dTDP-4-dehydrorhamnose 3,5-epimerase